MPCKYILYQKELYIVPENLTKNRTCQSWRGRQLAMSDDYDALKEYAENLAKKRRVSSGTSKKDRERSVTEMFSMFILLISLIGKTDKE